MTLEYFDKIVKYIESIPWSLTQVFLTFGESE